MSNSVDIWQLSSWVDISLSNSVDIRQLSNSVDIKLSNSVCGSFFMASEVLEAPRSRKEKMTTTLPFLGQEIKWGVNFIWEKLFPITDQESWLYNSNIGQILNSKS